jgi:5-oxoprolinase (ATP-hydrolysing)/N-methylhydantoinase B
MGSFEAPKLVLDKCDLCGRFLFAGEPQVARGGRAFCTHAVAEAAAQGTASEELVATLRLCPHWPMPCAAAAAADIDPAELEVFAGAFRSICLEMGNTMVRTAHSPVFYEGEDFTVAVFDPQFRRVAMWEGNPAQLGSLEYGVRAAIAQFGWDNIHNGDVILHNNSYVGTPHLPEFLMTKPVFCDGKPIAIVVNIAHHADVGGKAPGGMPGDATDIHQEGMLIPPVKAFERGRPVEAIWRIILSNLRTPGQSYGDFLAMVGSIEVGERRIQELIGRHGVATVTRYMQALQDHAERRMRFEIAKIPNGVYRGQIAVHDDGVVADHAYPLHVAVIVLDRDVIFDFRGSAGEARGPVNCPFGVTVASAVNALFNVVDPTVPRNQGAYAPLHFLIPRGTILNCDYPSPLNAGNSDTHNIIAEGCLAAFAKVLPDRVTAPSGATVALFSGGGITRSATGEVSRYAFVQWEPIGWGATRSRDGNIGITWVGVRSKIFSTEVLESRFPWRIERYEIRPDSGGAGQFRGGVGVERCYRLLGPEMTLNAVADYFKAPAAGMAGGHPGASTDIRIVDAIGAEGLASERLGAKASPTKFSGVMLHAGEGFLIRSPGGGGYGAPGLRTRERVLADVFDGYITAGKAIADYGVTAAEVDAVARRRWEFVRAQHQRGTGADVSP